MHFISRLDLNCCCCCLWLFWLLVAIDTWATNLNFIDVKFGATEFTTIGAHGGEVFQVCTMGTKVDVLETEESMVQRKCMQALKGEVMRPITLAHKV